MNARDLKVLRTALDFTQEEMADLLCRSKSAIKGFESGRKPVDRQTKLLLMALLANPQIRQELEGAHYSPNWPERGMEDHIGRVLAKRPRRCRACRVLIGPGHVEMVSHGGLCRSCARSEAAIVESTPRGR